MTNQIEQMSGLELLKSLGAKADGMSPIAQFLGIESEHIEFGKVTFSLLTRPEFANPLGTLHGGICAALLDSAMAIAVHSTLEAGIGYGTLEIKVNYTRAVPTDGVRLFATGEVIHSGRKIATAEGKVLDENGKLVAHGTTTVMIHR